MFAADKHRGRNHRPARADNADRYILELYSKLTVFYGWKLIFATTSGLRISAVPSSVLSMLPS